MRKIIRRVWECFVLFAFMGELYSIIELVWRGHTHFSMYLLAGLCGMTCGLLNEVFTWDFGLVWQALIGGGLITIAEFITGLIVNIWLKLGVWDYSGLPLNIMGQICLPFYFAWVALSVAAIVLDDYIRYWYFDEEKPRYKLF